MTISAEILHQLAQFDTPTICNVIELFDVRPRNVGYMDQRIRAAFPEMPPMVGFAATCGFRSSAPPDGNTVYGSLDQQLELMAKLGGPAVITIQDFDDPPAAAVFGEVMCSTYRAFGAAGLVTSGAGRDLEQVRALQFPVFTGSTICSHGYCHLLYIGQTVRLGGLVVRTGDLLHGDANGITNIPLDIAADVADAAREFVAAEKDVLQYMQGSGEKTIARAAALLKELSQATAELRKRIQAKRSASR